MENRQRLVRRLDMLFFIGLLITSGLAAILFSVQYQSDEGQKKSTPALATSAAVPSQTITNVPSPTPTLTVTASSTAAPTATGTPVPALTLTLTATHQPAPLIVAPLAVDEIHAGESVTISGSAQPGATITLYDGDEVLGETTAGSTGDWSITLPQGLDEGPHQLSIQAVGPDGSASQQAPVGFEVSTAPTQTITPLPTNTPTATPSSSPTRTPTLTRTATIAPTRTPRPTQTPTVTFTVTPVPTHTPSPSRTATQQPTQTPVPTAAATTVPSRTPQPSVASSPSLTATQRPTRTPQPTSTPTPYPTNTVTGTPSPTPSVLPPSKTPIPPSPTDSGQGGGVSIGQLPTITPTITITYVSTITPHIDAPANGETYAPGTIPVRGIGQPGAVVEIMNQGAETILATVPVAPDGTWETTVVLQGAGKEILVAMITVADGTRLLSNPVQITIAPAVQPQTGSQLKGDPDETGRTFTALLALLLAAGGFSAYFAGRLLYLVAHDRLKPR